MNDDPVFDAAEACVQDDPHATVTPPPDPEFPHIPFPIIRPVVGSPYYIHPRTGHVAFLSRPGTPPLTSEDVRRELEDFP
jgi:hypothetical protein